MNMNVTTETAGQTAEQVEQTALAAPEPEHPFRGLTEGWERVHRGPGRSGARVESSLVIELDPERTAWVFAEAERTGLATQPQRIVESLIDAARSAAGGQRER